MMYQLWFVCVTKTDKTHRRLGQKTKRFSEKIQRINVNVTESCRNRVLGDPGREISGLLMLSATSHKLEGLDDFRGEGPSS